MILVLYESIIQVFSNSLQHITVLTIPHDMITIPHDLQSEDDLLYTLPSFQDNLEYSVIG